jgi:hypothetical protein
MRSWEDENERIFDVYQGIGFTAQYQNVVVAGLIGKMIQA